MIVKGSCRRLLLALCFLLPAISFSQALFKSDYFRWTQLPDLIPFGNQNATLGVAGSYTGVHDDVLILAGGASADSSGWGMKKSFHKDILALKRDATTWQKAGELPLNVGYGSSVSTEYGVICMGGRDGEKILDEVFILKWDIDEQRVTVRSLIKLPCPCAYGGATLQDGFVYIAGGQSGLSLSTAMKNFWRIKLVDLVKGVPKWEILPSWNGPSRAFNLTVAQSNGESDCIYILSGTTGINGSPRFLKDGYVFNPENYENKQDPWKTVSDLPASIIAGQAIPLGQNHIFVMGGADTSLFSQEHDQKHYPEYPKTSFGFNTITNTWFDAGEIPVNQVSASQVIWEDQIVIPGGEINPLTQTSKVWILTPIQKGYHFGWVNAMTLVIYLGLMIGVGIFFSFRNKSTDDFFRGGQRVPWWAAGLSIFATMLSSLTFIAIPAKAYATNWSQSIINLGILLVAPFIVWVALPFFRKLNVTSAYEYLEIRFNVLVRLLASSLFVFFQIGRMAIVMYLPSLALSIITSLSVETCILIIGTLSILYSTMGGLEAVIWTDAMQAIILLGGALLCFVMIILNLEGGLSDYFRIASEHQKFHAINWDWDTLSVTRSAFWVVLLGGIAQAIIPGSADQAVIQRYMSVDSESKARKAIWTNAIITIPATLLFFAVGTALFVYYKINPTHLDPSLQIDAIFPLFIANELPIGISGLLVAGIFAAAQSTISTSMNSTSTTIVTDFIKRFKLCKTDREYLNVARILTVALGLLGTSFAMIMANANILSLWDTFMKIIGLFGGPLCGVFLLGMLDKRANSTGVILGLIFGVAAVSFIQISTNVSYLLHAGIGIVSCMFVGCAASLVTRHVRKL